MCVRGGGGGAHRAVVANDRSLTRDMWNKYNITDTLTLKRRKMFVQTLKTKGIFSI